MNKKFAALGCLIFVQTAVSHEFPLNLVYPNDTMSIAATFDLSKSQLEKVYNNHSIYFDYDQWIADKTGTTNSYSSCTNTTTTTSKTCGDFDHFQMAFMAGTTTCNALAALNPGLYSQGLLPRFLGPAEFTNGFNASNQHHSSYDTSLGIKFDCVYKYTSIKTVIK
ncbi:MAG: hypothetical protein HWD86_03385 [Kangiellaceae bacterium]|nr:hypothetical protein [Kangiellaceae bacterium]